jgi:hypothetical protein
MRVFLFAIATLSACGGAAVPAASQPTSMPASMPDRPRLAFDEGTKLFEQKKYQEAAAQFAAGRELGGYPQAIYLYNEALATEKFDKPKAIGLWKEYLANGTTGTSPMTDSDVNLIKARMKALESGGQP